MSDAGEKQPSDQPEVVHVSSAGAMVAVRAYGPRRGHPRDVPIVLLPGLFIGEYLWRHTAPFLVEHGFQVVTLCEPTAMIDTSIQSLKRHIETVIDILELSSVIICGNSLGGLLAVEFAATFPQRTRAIMVSGAPGLGNDYAVDVGARLTFDRAAMNRLAERLVYDKSCIPSDEVDALAHRFADRRFRRNLAISLRVATRHDLSSVLSEVTCPVLLVWGEKDSLTSANQWKCNMHRFRRPCFHTIADCGHAPMFERPEVFNPVLLAFLEQHSS